MCKLAVIPLVLSLQVPALEIERIEYEGIPALYITEEYEEHDYDLFMSYVEEYPEAKTLVMGDSLGGLTAESYPIGTYVKDNGYDTIVPSGVRCVSSCGLVWLAGDKREIEEGGSVHLHAPYVPTDFVLELRDEGLCEENEEDGTEVCKPFTDKGFIDFQRTMNRQSIANMVYYMFYVEAEDDWIINSTYYGPDETYMIEADDLTKE